MERDDSAGSSQSFSLGLGDHEYQADSSKWPVDDCTIGNASFKKSRLNDVELRHREDDAHRSFPGDFCQARAMSGSHRAKRQSFWDTILCDDEHRSGFSRTNMDNQGNPGQNPQTGYSGHCETAGFDFFQAGGYTGGCNSSSSSVPSWEVGNSCREAIPSAGMGSWSGDADVSHTGIIPSMDCLLGGAQSDGKGTSNLVSSVDQSPENIKGKGFVLGDHSREVHRTMGDHMGQADYEISNLGTGVEGGKYLDPTIHSFSLSPSAVEDEEKSFHLGSFACSSVAHSGNSRPDHGSEERRSSCKRKFSTTGLDDISPFQGSQSSLWRESLPATTGATGSIRPDSNGLSSSANFSITSNDPVIQIWDYSPSDRTGFTCNANDSFEPLRGTNRKASTSDGNGDGSPRTLQDQSIGMSQEPSHSQLRSLFARNLSRSMPAPHSQNLYSRRVSFTEQQVGQSGENGTSVAGDIDHWSTVYGERSSTSSVPVTSGGINPSRRGNPAIPRFVVRERASNVFEGSRMRGMSNRVSRGAGRALLDNRLASQATSSQVLNGSAVRRTPNSSETRVRTNQVANPFPNLGGASSSRLSALLSNSHSSGGINRNTPPPILPATVSDRPNLITSAQLPRGSQAGLRPSGTRSALFVDGRGEGIPGAPIQSILGLPFHGLHMLPADGEHRRRFLSEILSALEHAWRSEDINFEELVMLDPSLIYGGIDAHDQHSDMRLDVDNMSYEELLALEERIGDVSTGLSSEMICVCVRESKYSSLDATVAAMSQESDVKCSVCQEEFVEEDELGRLDCGHGYHTICINQWLLQKNLCPICKSPAYSKS